MDKRIVGFDLYAANGKRGHYDISSGALYVGGCFAGKIPFEDVEEEHYIVETGRFGKRIKKFGKKLKKPLNRLAGAFSKIANSKLVKAVARIAPPPISTAAQAAQSAANIVNRLRNRDPGARAQVAQLAQQATNGNSRARDALALVRQTAQIGVAQGQAAGSLLARIRSGDRRAIASVEALRNAAARGDGRALRAIAQLQGAVTAQVRTSGWSDDLRDIWDRLKPHAGILTTPEIAAMGGRTNRTRYAEGLREIASR